jgi:hypothetical protein
MLEKQTTISVRYPCKPDGAVFPMGIAINHFVWRGCECHIAAMRDITERLAPGDINLLISNRRAGWGEHVARRTVELQAPLASDLPPALVESDYTAQAIGHVVNNAVNYTHAGSIMLSTATRSDEAGRRVTLNVAAPASRPLICPTSSSASIEAIPLPIIRRPAPAWAYRSVKRSRPSCTGV